MDNELFEIENALPEMPKSFERSTEQTLARLGVKEERQRSLRFDRRKLAVLIAAAVLIVSVTAFAAASAIVLKRTGGSIGYFDSNDSAGIAAQQPHYERIGDEVDVVLTADDVTLTIDNIALEDERITVFYTVSSAKGIADGAELPELYGSIDGGNTACAYPLELTPKRVDANTFTCMQTMWLKDPLPEVCTLTVFCRSLFGVDKYVSAELAVDTSEVPANVSEGEYLVVVDDGRYEHTIIARVYIDNDGGVLELSETVPNTKYDENHNEIMYLPFVDFAVFDEEGNSLNPHINGIQHGAPGSKAVNKVKFDADMETGSVTIVPMRTVGDGYVDLMLDDIGEAFAASETFSVTLTDAVFDYEARTLTVSYIEDGVYPVSMVPSLSRFVDENGELLECGDVATAEEIYRDDATGVYTQTAEFWTRIFDMHLIRGVRFRCYVPQLDYDNAVTIPVGAK